MGPIAEIDKIYITRNQVCSLCLRKADEVYCFYEKFICEFCSDKLGKLFKDYKPIPNSSFENVSNHKGAYA